MSKDLQDFSTLVYADYGLGLLSSIWTGDQYIAVGYNGKIITSPDGSNLTLHNSPTSEDLLDVVGSSIGLVAVGANGAIVYSIDGSNWSKISISNVNTDFKRIEFLNNRFVAVGSNGTIATSTNGTTWAIETTATSSNLCDVAYNGIYFVAITDRPGGHLFVSKDLVNWSRIIIDPDSWLSLIAIEYTGDEFVAIAANYPDNTLIASDDGISWDFILKDISYNLTDIAWTGTDFIMTNNFIPITIGEID